MRYTVIFADGYDDDLESLARDLRTDILISDEEGKLYNPFFITIERVTNEFDKNKICYLEDNLVILHSVTKDNIIKAIVELYEWMFYKRWLPLSDEHLKTYFSPKENWVTFDVEI
nr:hypothetical protein [uncultured Chryseobacterium sp.]